MDPSWVLFTMNLDFESNRSHTHRTKTPCARARSERRGAAESGSQLADSQDGLGWYDGYIPDMAGWEIPYKCYKWQCK